MSFHLQNAVNNLLVLGLVGALGYFAYLKLTENAVDPSENACVRERGEMLARCQPQCDDLYASDQPRGFRGKRELDPEVCVQTCVQREFGKELPLCQRPKAE